MIIDQKAEQEIHMRQLYIAQAVFDLCKEEGIHCFLVGGSLLGAIKEGNILKGDKDIDIGMMREDYERFCKIAYRLPPDLSFLEAHIDPSYNWLFAKVYQKGTKFIPKYSPLFSDEIGIYIDINPYDFVSEDIEKRQREYRRAKIKKWFLILKRKPTKGNIKLKFVSLIGRKYSRNQLLEFFSSGRKITGVVQNLVGGTEKDWFTYKEISNLKEVIMGEHLFMAPEYERYLDSNYPEWREKDMSRMELYNYEVEYE